VSHRPRRRGLPALIGALCLVGCANIGQRPASSLTALPGWGADDHAAALAVFQASCRRSSAADLAASCAGALALGSVGEEAARRFFEANFRPEAAAAPGLLTAYFAPVYEARRVRGGLFTAPLRPPPDDLPSADGGPGGHEPYADRAAIEARGTDDALAWMRPEELFWLQVQGSGVLVFDDGGRLQAAFAGSNGLPYLAISAPLRERGAIGEHASGDDVRRWLAAHRGLLADEIMNLDRRYVFFRLLPDDDSEPTGADGAPLAPGRSIAVDLSAHRMGELFWIDAETPTISGAVPAYRRLVVAVDTGGAIKGTARADLYLGRGEVAGQEAGRVRHALRLYRLAPTGERRP
jgi:membrane-bound lytic murein transglycosylase A